MNGTKQERPEKTGIVRVVKKYVLGKTVLTELLNVLEIQVADTLSID